MQRMRCEVALELLQWMADAVAENRRGLVTCKSVYSLSSSQMRMLCLLADSWRWWSHSRRRIRTGGAQARTGDEDHHRAGKGSSMGPEEPRTSLGMEMRTAGAGAPRQCRR
jgi:hypothetical protein